MKPIAQRKLTNSRQAYEEGQTLIPGGVLGIRRPYNFVEGEYPIYVDSGQGGRVTDIDGNEYIDFLCGYGPIILGYRETEVDNAVIEQIREKGFCFSLTQTLQNQLAAKLREVIPCAEMSLFVKTGSDATTAAIRLARGHTGRVQILRCGYHGWHDWCVEVRAGIPPGCYAGVHEFAYNDLAGLEELVTRHADDTAAIILTPYGHPLGAAMLDPEPGFLEGVRALADESGAVLIFDEIRTGFRLALGGGQERFGVLPDLATFGKAMANGYAIGAVCGRAEIMRAGERDVFISSTFFPNSDGYVAALKTIEILQRDAVLDAIWDKGDRFLTRVREVVARRGAGARLSGIPPMFFITFDKDSQGTYRERRTAFYTQLIRRGVFLQPYHHGYICHRHTEVDLDTTVAAIDTALA